MLTSLLSNRIYWQFKYFQDITTCTPVGEGFYDGDGNVYDEKVKVLSRVYPQAVAGTSVSYNFRSQLQHFDMEFTPVADISSYRGLAVQGLTSVVYWNRNYHYKTGIIVDVAWKDSSVTEDITQYFTVSCSGKLTDFGGYVNIKQSQSVGWGNGAVAVKITPCRVTEAKECTCH